MLYVLIILSLTTGTAPGGSSTAEFNTEKACEAAAGRINGMFASRAYLTYFYSHKAFCMPKGEKPKE